MSDSPALTRSATRLANVATASRSAPSRLSISDRRDSRRRPRPDGRIRQDPALTNWSFEQLAAIAGAPPKYLQTLPATIAASAINHGLQRHRREQEQLFID